MSFTGVDRDIIDRQNKVLEAIFATTDCGMMRHTVDGNKLISINEAALRILGFETKEELTKAGFDMIASSVAEEDKPKLKQCIRSLKKPGDSTSVNYRVVHKNGKMLDVEGRIKLLEENGELIYQRFLFDVTAQKNQERQKQQEEEQRHIDIVKALSVDFSSVFYLDLDAETGFFYRVNEYIASKLGTLAKSKMKLKECMDMYRLNAVYEEDRDLFEQAVSARNIMLELSVKPFFYFNYRVLINGKINYCQIKIVRVGEWDREHNCVMGFKSVDEDTRRQMEQKNALSDALAQAEHASRSKTVFLNNVSNDIRIPLNNIMECTKNALGGFGDRELVRDSLDSIITSSNQILSLLNEVLDMSRIDSGKMILQEDEYCLDDLAEEIDNIIRKKAADKNQQFTIDMENVVNKDVICDIKRLNQVILNCLDNAVKYTPEEGKIDFKIIQCKGAPVGFAKYEFKIKDNGAGMSSEFVRHIFEPFKKEENSNVNVYDGCGLGMAITKNIVDMMKGTISVESTEGKGSEFTITLCFRIAMVHNIPVVVSTDRRETFPMKGRSILFVDDVEFNRDIAEIVLNVGGFKVDSVCNGKEAVDRIAEVDENEYDLILMDIQMPVMDGYEACRRIREMDNPVKASIPIFAMTSKTFEDDRRCSIEAGMDGHLTKPIQINELYAAIRRHVK
jgi:PAS domain S-box-containing protein